MKKKEIAVLQRIEEAERWRDSYYKDNWRSYIDLYRSKLPEKRDGSNLFVPYTFMTCEVVRTRLAESLFSSRPYVSLLPRNADTTRITATVPIILENMMLKLSFILPSPPLRDPICQNQTDAGCGL